MLVRSNQSRLQKSLMISFLSIIFLATTFSANAGSIFQTKKLKLVETTDESASQVQELVRELSSVRGNATKSTELGEQILALIKKGADINDYDYLWTLYSLIINAGPELDGGMAVKDYLKITDSAMNFLENNGVGDWVFTDFGQFQMEVYRQAANAAAWTLRESKPKKALPYIEAGMQYMREEDLWMQDTRVRILLNMDKKEEAYKIVKTILAEAPDFSDFQDFTSNQDYLNWLKDS